MAPPSSSSTSTAPGPTTTAASTSSYSYPTITTALTTIYTPPALCKDRLFTLGSSESGSLIQAALLYSDAPECYPPSYDYDYGTSYLYSPGVCPLRWTVNHYTSSSSGNTITTQVCCSSGYQPIGYLYCASWLPPNAAKITVPSSGTTSFSVSVLVADWPVHVAWVSSDLPLFTPASAPILPAYERSARPTSTSSTTTPSSPSSIHRPSRSYHTKPSHSSPSTPGRKSSSLTSGDKIGIGVGAGVGGLLLIVAAVVLLLWHRKRAQRLRSSAEISTLQPNRYSDGFAGSPVSTNYDKTQSNFGGSPRY